MGEVIRKMWETETDQAARDIYSKGSLPAIINSTAQCVRVNPVGYT